MDRLAEHIALLRSEVAGLDRAFEAASECWQTVPVGDTWSPRIAAEHIVPAIVIYVDFIGDEMGLPPFDWSSLPASLPTAAAGRSGLAQALLWDMSVIDALSEEMLDSYMVAMEDWPAFPTTIGGALRMVANHARQHREQVEAMVQAANEAAS